MTMMPMLTALRCAIGAIILIILMLARPMAITDLAGSRAASSLVQVPGTDGAGVTAGAVTDTAAAGAIAAGTMTDIAAVGIMAIVVVGTMAIAADTRTADAVPTAATDMRADTDSSVAGAAMLAAADAAL